MRPILTTDLDDFCPNTMRGKHILVLGATSRLGVCVVDQALEASYHVTVLVREDRNLPFKKHHLRNPNFVVCVGSVLDRSNLDKVVEGKDAIINCLGPRNTWFGDTTISSRAQPIINESMKSLGVKRIIVVTSQGCGDSIRYVRPIQHFFVRLFVGKVIDDKQMQEFLILENKEDLDWTIIRPGRLVDGKLTKRYRINEHLTFTKINRADVAHFILQELRTSMWLKRTPTVNG
ncbi:4144_t:CDS:2, partial [Ambispora leptoticha]